MQRVRMSLPHFVRMGWECTVLTVTDDEPAAPLEPALLDTVPSEVEVVRVPALRRRWARLLGIGNIGLRALWPLYATGRRLLRQRRSFDLVYFSTTQFAVCPLARIWRHQTGIPYIIDLQDPWLNDYYERPGAPLPPGGWKYRFARALAKQMEKWTLRRCAHVISVSATYLETLARRYPWFVAERDGTVLAFGAPDEDFAVARQQHLTQPRMLPDTPTLKIAYAGRLGPDMYSALRVLLAATARLRETKRPMELFFFGTSYAAAGQTKAITTELANQHEVIAFVHEHPARIGYLTSLRLLLETDVALIIGSEDAAYAPSKIHPTLFAAKPTIAIAPHASVLEQEIRRLGGAAMIGFDPSLADDHVAIEKLTDILRQHMTNPTAPLGPPADIDCLQQEHSAAAVAQRQLVVFEKVLHLSSSAAQQ